MEPIGENGEAIPDFSPEARRRAASRRRFDPDLRAYVTASGFRRWRKVARCTITRTWNDGFVHAGNLAYITIFAIFPFFIFGAAVLSALGESGERTAAVDAVLQALPPSVGEVIGPAAREVIGARHGWLLWAGVIFALWTVGGLIEAIRDILRRAYGTVPTRNFWIHRLASVGVLVGAVLLLVTALLAQMLIGVAEEFIDAWLPQLNHLLRSLALSRIIPALAVYLSIFLLFLSLTPARYRGSAYPKWPGALLITVWWMGVTAAFPPLLRYVFSYDLTYGSLAGIMITLFFFWLIGLGMVAGAELNAALATTPEEEDAAAASEVEQEETVQ